MKNGIYFCFIGGLICKNQSSSFKNVKSKYVNFLSKDLLKWGADSVANPVSSPQTLYAFPSKICCTLSGRSCCVYILKLSWLEKMQQSIHLYQIHTVTVLWQRQTSNILLGSVFKTISILLRGKRSWPKIISTVNSVKNPSAASAASWLCKPRTFPIIVSVHPGSVSLRPSSRLSLPLHLSTGRLPSGDGEQSTRGAEAPCSGDEQQTCESWCNITLTGHGLLIPRHLRD